MATTIRCEFAINGNDKAATEERVGQLLDRIREDGGNPSQNEALGTVIMSLWWRF